MAPSGPIVIAAGGTGGHLFPAQALAEELAARGHAIELMTDARVNRFAADFPARAIHEIPAATFGLGQPARIPGALWRLSRGFMKARAQLKVSGAIAVVGFGGYPTLPPLFAARTLALPTCIHEQNAVMGRVNRLLARRVTVVAGSFDAPRHLPHSARDAFVLTGNPVRPKVKVHRKADYTRRDGAPLRVLVVGGSQGARILSDVVPDAIGLLPSHKMPAIVQQCRKEDMQRVAARYSDLGVAADLAPFFTDLPERMAKCDLVIARAGASTVFEVAVIGRPAILIPLAHALDQDQLENAKRFVDHGAGWVIEERDFTAASLCERIAHLIANGTELDAAAAAAATFGEADAEKKLADAVERMITS